MTAVALPDQTPPGRTLALVPSRPDPLMTAVAAFDQMRSFAQTLVASGFLPKSINTPEKAVAVMLAGREMGIGPMQSLRSIHIIDAKPVVAADLQLARFKADGGRATFRQLDDNGAVLHLVHPNGDEHVESFTTADAQAAQLLGKDTWKKHRKAMFRSRVITAGLKSIGYEPVAGVYDPDEADHFRPGASAAIARGEDPNGGAVEADFTVEPATPAAPASAPASAPTQRNAEPATFGSNAPEAHCPKCGGAMWDNSLSKRNPKAPDYKCRDNSCDGVFWPGQWPPKPAASPEQRKRIDSLLATAELTPKKREKIVAKLADAAQPLNHIQADELIAKLEDAQPEPSEQTTLDDGAAHPALKADEDDGLPF